MFLDVLELRKFYDSRLGRTTQRQIRASLRRLWPRLDGLSLLGLGYAPPYLCPFCDEAERVIACMPATQGVTHWPRDGHNRVTLAEETALPFDDESFDRILLVHGAENSEQRRPMLREVWRVLKGEGRIVVVVPNRTGIWAQLERTPFGHGHPFSPGQIERVMRDAQFAPEQQDRALFFPPLETRVLLAAASTWDRVGRRWAWAVAGVLLIEARKQMMGATPLPLDLAVTRQRGWIAAEGFPRSLPRHSDPIPQDRKRPPSNLPRPRSFP